MESSESTSEHFAFSEGVILERLRAEWGKRFVLHAPESVSLTLWDSFEWQLWFGGLVLYSSEGVYHLCARDGGWIGAEISSEKISGSPSRYAADFKAPAAREKLASLLALRGLAPVGTAVFRRRLAELRNDKEKIVCRFDWLEVLAGPNDREAIVRYCRVRSLLGYEMEAQVAAEALRAHGAQACAEGPLEILLRNACNLPRPYSLRPVFDVDPHMSARDAVGRIVRAMLVLLRENEERIPGDVDTEFLHDYRICLRKIRSVLSLVKGIYPEKEAEKMRHLLARLARETNKLRDLDVYLLSRERYMEMLPPAFRAALGAMFSEFAAERASEILKVTRTIRSKAHHKRMAELETFFNESTVHDPTENAFVPVGPFVFQRIYKRYRKIRAIAATLEDDAPDEAVHQVRIEGKKLRYLIEFFEEIIPTTEVATAEKQLRRLQAQLGNFNDCSVQQKALLDYWEKKKNKPGDQLGIALSLGGLVSLLHRSQLKQRERIFSVMNEFCSDITAAVIKQNFKSSTAGPAATSSCEPSPL